MAHRPPELGRIEACRGVPSLNRSQKIPVCRPTPGARTDPEPCTATRRNSLCTDRADRLPAARHPSFTVSGIFGVLRSRVERAPIRPRHLLPHDPVSSTHPPSTSKHLHGLAPGRRISSRIQIKKPTVDHNGRPHTLPFRLRFDMQDRRAAML